MQIFLAQNGVAKPPVKQESCKQVNAKENDKRDEEDVASKLSCGAPEVISKADETGMFVKVKINGKILEFFGRNRRNDNIGVKEFFRTHCRHWIFEAVKFRRHDC
jgi:hypothetical protein